MRVLFNVVVCSRFIKSHCRAEHQLIHERCVESEGLSREVNRKSEFSCQLGRSERQGDGDREVYRKTHTKTDIESETEKQGQWQREEERRLKREKQREQGRREPRPDPGLSSQGRPRGKSFSLSG